MLIVDDNAVNRRIFVETLDRWQMQPTAVDRRPRGARGAAEQRRTQGSPSRSCCSTRTCRISTGSRSRERIRQQQTLAGATIMMLTSSGQYGDSARCRELGIAAYLTKPIKPADLLEAIDGALERSGADARSRAPATAACAGCAAQRFACCSPRTIPSTSGWPSASSSRRGHTVVVANNGQEAIERARARDASTSC